MSEETLLTAARRVVRFVRVDENQGGGLLSRDTLKALETLDKQVLKEAERLKLAQEQAKVFAEASI